jgi:hypothetical protein
MVRRNPVARHQREDVKPSSTTYSVNTEPLRTIAAKCEATETTRSFGLVVDTFDNRLQNTEDAVHL